MAFSREDLEPIETWLNDTGLSEEELGQEAAGNPDALKQLRDGTAPPATLLALITYINKNPSR